MPEAETIARRLERTLSAIDEARHRAGRSEAVALIAVSKTVDADIVHEAYAAGQRLFGENRVQEATQKMGMLRDRMPEARWHLLGHLQTNKTRLAGSKFDMVQSVDSERVAVALNDAARSAGRRLPVLLEVNVGGESSKSGWPPGDLSPALTRMQSLEQLDFRGLMTIAPLVDEPEEVRPIFRSLRALRDEILRTHGLDSFLELSMGMSNDYQVAIEEGATMVRIGRALFGQRPSTG